MPLVLVIEDDDHQAEALTRLLESRGYATLRRVDGLEAIERLNEERMPDLILLDLLTPRMDGWEFRLAQRSHPAWAGIPVVALSGDRSPKARAIDADAHFAKPLNHAALLGTLKQLLSEARRKRADAQASELERSSSLGALTAGLAHNLNNPLSLQLGHTAVARRACSELERELEALPLKHVETIRRSLVQIEESTERIASAVRDIANFARSGRTEPVDLSEVLDGSLRLVSNHLHHRGKLERNYAPVPRVQCSPAKLGQLLLILLVRAVQVLDESQFEHNVVRLTIELAAEGTVRVRITDTGPGVSAERLAALFSAADGGHDGGAQLALVQRLAQELGGHLSIRSSVLNGTCFTLSLPSVRMSGAPDRGTPQVTKELPATRARLLIIDDEAGMCDLLALMLHDTYDVTTSCDPRASLARLQAGEAFDLILSDLMMPGLNGMALHAALVAQRPAQAARMVFMTGGTFSEPVRDFVAGLDTYLRKPFDEQALRSLLARKLHDFRYPSRALQA